MEAAAYKNRIHTFLMKMVPGQKIELSKICIPGNEQKFINTCATLLSENWNTYGWKISFTSNYTHIKRNESGYGETFDKFFNLNK